MSAERNDVAREDPRAQLERALISEYLQRHGYTLATLHELPDDQAGAVLRQATLYASGRLTEVESRAHYVDDMHHGPIAPSGRPPAK